MIAGIAVPENLELAVLDALPNTSVRINGDLLRIPVNDEIELFRASLLNSRRCQV